MHLCRSSFQLLGPSPQALCPHAVLFRCVDLGLASVGPVGGRHAAGLSFAAFLSPSGAYASVASLSLRTSSGRLGLCGCLRPPSALLKQSHCCHASGKHLAISCTQRGPRVHQDPQQLHSRPVPLPSTLVQGGTRLGRVDLKSLPVEIAFAPDMSVLAVVVQVGAATKKSPSPARPRKRVHPSFKGSPSAAAPQKGLHTRLAFHSSHAAAAPRTSTSCGSVPGQLSTPPGRVAFAVRPQDWVVYSVSLVTWRVRTLVPRRAKMDHPLERCLLAVAPVRTGGSASGE